MVSASLFSDFINDVLYMEIHRVDSVIEKEPEPKPEVETEAVNTRFSGMKNKKRNQKARSYNKDWKKSESSQNKLPVVKSEVAEFHDEIYPTFLENGKYELRIKSKNKGVRDSGKCV